MTILNSKGEIIIGGTLANYTDGSTLSDPDPGIKIVNQSTTLTGGTRFVPQAIRPIFDSLADSNSGRTEDGIMHINWIRKRMRKWEITMPPMNAAQYATLLKLVQGQSYDLLIYDILQDKEIQLSVYTSNANADMVSGVVDYFYGGVLYKGLWRGLKFSAIEV